MSNNILSLNGQWLVDYISHSPYNHTSEPVISVNSDTATTLPVPGYWEDSVEMPAFAGLRQKMKINPMYRDECYPMTGYCPDMFMPNPVGCLAYGKTVSLETVPVNARLYIGGAQNTVSAWVNGVYLGRHEGYCTPFSFGIPHGVLIPGENRITLAVSNERLKGYMRRPVSGLTSRAANECTGGIYGDVALCGYPDGLRDLWVTVAEDCDSFTVHTQGAENAVRTVTVQKDGKTVHKTQIPVGETGVVIAADGYEKWSPENPRLYQLTVQTDNQSLSCNFGVRRLTAKGTGLYLNGEPYYFRGICEHCYQYATVYPTREKNYYVRVLRKLKALGFNAIRTHTWVPPYEYMEAADEEGMLIEVECPNNSTLEQWEEIVHLCRHYTSVNIYSTGNELQIDDDYEKHLSRCGQVVHSQTDSLFSPMSAMRGVEYMLRPEDPRVEAPFTYNPQRLARLGAYCDLYNSYSLGLTSYDSAEGTQQILDQRNAVYGKPLLSHEICIQGTYIDLSLEERYKDTRIGKTQFMSSVRRHLEAVGLLEKAHTYYQNSVKWQSLLRKHCFETVRRCHSFAGYDFLGDIDTHWHTFGYCVGMMNEFYELKDGETRENVLRYNSPTVLLADLPRVNVREGDILDIPLWVSHYGADISRASLWICITRNGEKVFEETVGAEALKRGTLELLHRVCFTVPQCGEAARYVLEAELKDTHSICSNRWELYAFPKTPGSTLREQKDAVVYSGCSIYQLEAAMKQGKTVVIFGTEPFSSVPVTFQLSVAGRTTGHLATVVEKHPITDAIPHDGFCGKQFENMLNGGRAAILTGAPNPHRPIIDIASSYKNAQKEGLLFTFGIEKGKLLVCTLNLEEGDPGAAWLKEKILAYAASKDFVPRDYLTLSQLRRICTANVQTEDGDSNRAVNRNDITA